MDTKQEDNKILYQFLKETKALTLEAIKEFDNKVFSLFKMIHNQDSKIKVVKLEKVRHIKWI